MSGFSADWLDLREPFDHAARATAAAALDLTGRLARWCQRSPNAALPVIDLACGLGSNLRILGPDLGGAQQWRLVDHDAALLDAVPDALDAWARRRKYRLKLDSRSASEQAIDIAGPDFHARVIRQRVDLARELASIDFGSTSLVTACALLDLVSASWLKALIDKARDSGAALLFGLTVDGLTAWHPADPGDEDVHRLFIQHQRRDKGFGPALGSQAAAIAVQQLACAGYETLQTQTDWIVDGAQAPQMQHAMIEGMAAAAQEQDPAAHDMVRSWKARRGACIGSSRLRVGHVDIVAMPA